MEKDKEREIIDIIKSDDLVSFSQLNGNDNILEISFGRFPVLSLCYLYNAKKIVKKFESQLLKVEDFRRVDEPFFLYKDFRNFAKKSVRLYQSDESIISPLEMLAILHRDNKLEKNFKPAHSNNIVNENLVRIYSSFYCQDVSIKNGKIKIGLKKISYKERSFLKRCLLISAVFLICLLGAMTAIDFTLGGVAFHQAKVYSSSQFVSALTSGSNAVLQNDFTLSGEGIFTTFSGEFDGNGHTIYVDFQGKSLIESNAGTIKNLNIVYQNFMEETTLSSSASLLCHINSGTISNVEISFAKEDITEKIVINLQKETSGNHFSGFAVTNSGVIKDCKSLLSVSIFGKGNGDGHLSGIAGENRGKILNCTVLENSVVEAFEVDLAGIVANNALSGEVKNCTNNANLIQNSSEDNWSPTVSGVVEINYGNVSDCRNVGELKISSTFADASSAVAVCGGVCGSNYGIISKSKNVGNIEVSTNTLSVYAGGVVAYNMNDLNVVSLENCGAEGEISVTTVADDAKAYVGGIGGAFFGQLTNCYSLVTFTTAFDESKNFVGASFGKVWYANNITTIIQYINGSQNFVLSSESVEHQIGIMVLKSNYFINDLFGWETGTNSSTGNQVVTSLSEIQDIKDLGVYYE